MGFFSNLKNSITGSWADLEIESNEGVRGETLNIKLVVKMKSSDISVDQIYLRLTCDEQINIDKYELSQADVNRLSKIETDQDFGMGSSDRNDNEEVNSTQGTKNIDITKSESLFNEKYVLAENVELEADREYSYDLAVDISSELPPSFKGKNCSIKWRAYSALDMKGNDPDSGWVDIVVK